MRRCLKEGSPSRTPGKVLHTLIPESSLDLSVAFVARLQLNSYTLKAVRRLLAPQGICWLLKTRGTSFWESSQKTVGVWGLQ